jgi:RNA polymerase sigma factor (sigma-70 family)
MDSDTLRILLRSREKFRAFLIQQTGSAEAADDILQQAYLRVSAKGERLQKKESLVPWFYRILRRLAIDHYRTRAAVKRRDEALVREAEMSQQHKAAAKRAQDRLCGCFQALLPSLKKEYGQILRRIDLENQPVADVAKTLKLTPNNLTVRLHRARIALRERLEQACGSCAKHGCLDCRCTHAPGV